MEPKLRMINSILFIFFFLSGVLGLLIYLNLV